MVRSVNTLRAGVIGLALLVSGGAEGRTDNECETDANIATLIEAGSSSKCNSKLGKSNFCDGIDNTKEIERYLDTLSKDENYKTADDKVTLSYVRQLGTLLSCKTDETQLADIYLMRSGLLGLYAKKNRSIDEGRKSYEDLQQAVRIAPKYYGPVQIYADTVINMSEKNLIVRYFIEETLEIDLEDERAKAISSLRQFNSEEARRLIKKLSEF